MKIFCYLFTFYILYLLAYPCQDDIDELFIHKTEKSTDSGHEHKDCHSCSPFCICNCCHVNTIVALKVIIKAVSTLPSLFISIYKEDSPKEIILPIWQPPKL